jgi:class 3 adenylate cyclase
VCAHEGSIGDGVASSCPLDERGFAVWWPAHHRKQYTPRRSEVPAAIPAVAERHGGDIDRLIRDAMMASLGALPLGGKREPVEAYLLKALR